MKNNNNMDVSEIAIRRRSRKGPSHQITADGAYWLAINVHIDVRWSTLYGDVYASDYYRVRHYRDGRVESYCETWCGMLGGVISSTRCDKTLKCKTREELESAISRVRVNPTWCGDEDYRVGITGSLSEGIPELPCLKSPDDID